MPAPAAATQLTKAEVQTKNERLLKSLKSMRELASQAEERVAEVAMDLGREIATVATAAIGAYWAGAFEKWDVFGIDASLVIGVPLLIGGYVATALGYDNLGSWGMALGRGFVVEYVARSAYTMGIDAKAKALAKEKEGAPKGYLDASGIIDNPVAGGAHKVTSARGW